MFRYTNTPARRARKIRELAALRVRRGVMWLHEFAREGWQRNLFQVSGASGSGLFAYPRFKTAYSAEDVLSLAFEFESRFADSEDGRVRGHLAAEHHDLSIKGQVDCGFMADEKVTCELLDELWLEALTSYAAPSRSAVRHSHRMRSCAA